MPSSRRFPKPYPVGDAFAQLVDIDPAMQGGNDYYMDDSQFMGGSLPPIDMYGRPGQQWNLEMLDRMIDTDIDRTDKDGNPMPRPKLWLFDSPVFRHFQLTNLRSRDQTEIERDIADILMLSHQDGNEDLCEEQQRKTYAKITMYKSRGDMSVPLRERDAWITTVNEMKSPEIKRPQGTGGFFADLLGKKRRTDY